VKVAKHLTNALRERASAGTGPFELAPNSDKELVDEKLMNNCGNEALVCMAPIGRAMKADYLMWGKIEKVDKGFHVTIELIRVATKTPQPTFSEIVPVAQIKNDPKGLAKRAYAKMTATDEGTVTVRIANADRAVVYVDDQPVGTTSSGVLTFNLPEGKHRLAVAANEKGWQPQHPDRAGPGGEAGPDAEAGRSAAGGRGPRGDGDGLAAGAGRPAGRRGRQRLAEVRDHDDGAHRGRGGGLRRLVVPPDDGGRFERLRLLVHDGPGGQLRLQAR
jgi:hypothetical protein